MRYYTILLSLLVVLLFVALAMPLKSLAQSITVVKATTPTGQGPFAFTSTTAPTNFILDGGDSQNFPGLAPF